MDILVTLEATNCMRRWDLNIKISVTTNGNKLEYQGLPKLSPNEKPLHLWIQNMCNRTLNWAKLKEMALNVTRTTLQCSQDIDVIRECIQKFPDWAPANGTTLCHYVQLYRYFVSQSSEFCLHNPLCYFSTSACCCCCCCCLFHYWLSL
jgi:hypothetical protein